MAKVRLTESYIKALPLPVAHHTLHQDTEARGLAVRITRTGARSFLFCYSFDGQERRMSLGPMGTARVQQAGQRGNPEAWWVAGLGAAGVGAPAPAGLGRQ